MRLIIGIVIGFVLAATFAWAKAKYEAGSRDAASVVAYGGSGANIIPVQVTANGNLITQ
jgi:hypothetical protein